jgi:hypothetical protein
MIDVSIANAVVALLVPYFKEGAEAFSKRVGEMSAEKAKAVYTEIKKKFRGDSHASESLTRIEEEPTSQGRQAVLAGELIEKMAKDPDFEKSLRKKMAEIDERERIVISAIGDGNVAGLNIINSNINTGNNK